MKEKKARNWGSLAEWRKVCAGFLIVSIGLLTGCGSMATKPGATNSAGKYPEKPITVIVPFSAGGALDMVARALEKKAPQYLGHPLIVVNKPGATGSIGWNELAAAPPDGYTIGITSVELIVNPLYGLTKYNYATALAPVAQVSAVSQVLAVRSDEPWDNIEQLVMYAKQHPGELKFGHSGIGSIPHIIGENFAKTSGVAIDQVPFRGASEAVAALLGGHVQLIIVNPMVISEFVNTGKIKCLAVSAGERMIDPLFERTPTFKEAGYEILFTNWLGVAIPKEVPPEIRDKLSAGISKIIHDPEFKQDIEKLGLPVTYLNPHDAEAVWLTDQQRYTKIVQESGILDKIREQKK